MEYEKKTVPKLSNGTIFNNFEPPLGLGLTHISRSRHNLTLNISETIYEIEK